MTNKPKRRLSKEEREAYSIVGAAGGRAIAKKLGKKGMRDLGTRGSEVRWGPREARRSKISKK